MEPERYISYAQLCTEKRGNIQKVSFDGQVSNWDIYKDGEIDQCEFKPLMTITELKKESCSLQALRKVSENAHALFVIHPTVDLIRIASFHYVVNYPKTIEIDATNSKELEKYFMQASFALYNLHLSNILHGAITPSKISYHDPNRQVLAIKWNGHLKSFAKFREDAEYSESPLLAPLQILLEMLNSQIEPELIEYSYFKNKFVVFWKHLCMRASGHQLQVIGQEYFAIVAGAVDYYDFILQRYCILHDDERYIRKDTSKAFGYLQDIDLFNLGMSIHIMANKKPSPILKKYIGECVRGNYIHPDDFDIPEKVFQVPVKPPSPPLPEPIPETVHNIAAHGHFVPRPAMCMNTDSLRKLNGDSSLGVMGDLVPHKQPEPIREPEKPEKPPEVSSPPSPKPRSIIEECKPVETSPKIPTTPAISVTPIKHERKQAAPLTRSVTTKNEQTSPITSEWQSVSMRNDPSITGEYCVVNGVKKVKLQGIERMVRFDPEGDYIIWKGVKLYLNL